MNPNEPSYDGLITDVFRGVYMDQSPGPFSINPKDIDVFVNSYGYRSDEFSMQQARHNYLFTGCSFTWGAGLPEGKSWASFVNNELSGEKYFNLGLLGQSINAIVSNIYRYVRAYGHPKAIFMLLPGLPRHDHAFFKKDVFLNKMVATNASSMLAHFKKHDLVKSKEEFDLMSHIFFPEQHLLYQAINQIKVLEEYLDMKGIPLIWSTWDKDFRKELRNVNVLKRYFEMGEVSPDTFINFEPKDAAEKKYWYNAGDFPEIHPGVAEQRHYADKFIKEFNRR